ncbi:MAG TPA: polysaccharide biosynthesis/export family protein [Acidobacteriaceae bacterium]|nr:polysaccharide biosynthesis/export family protein [Acidobacteriaceae bacterium]
MKINLLRSSLLTICFVSVTTLVQAQPGTARPAISPAAQAQAPYEARAAEEAAGPLTVSMNYVIGANDSIKVDVRDAKLQPVETESGILPVRPDGKITLPLLGDIQAAGFTPTQLAADITTRITKYILDPIVTVSVLAVNSKQVFLAGEVSRVGPMPITPGLTILQAIASAGLSPYANRKHIYILRGDPAKPQKIMFDYNKAVKKGDMQGIALVPGDTIVVP